MEHSDGTDTCILGGMTGGIKGYISAYVRIMICSGIDYNSTSSVETSQESRHAPRLNRG